VTDVSGRRAGVPGGGWNRITDCAVAVCRGCCCGTVRKHPQVDHEGQVHALRHATDVVRVRVTDCLNACERSNVLVVGPTPAARRHGARPVWLGDILDDATVTAVIEWVAAGGPGRAAIPARLAPHQFTAPRWKPPGRGSPR